MHKGHIDIYKTNESKLMIHYLYMHTLIPIELLPYLHDKKSLKRDNRYQQDKKRKLCKRRAAIEPIIGHLKSDYGNI
jgi:hypothetical protein